MIREIRQFQQSVYKIDRIDKVCAYLLDPELQLEDETLYQKSLMVEPRSSRLSTASFTAPLAIVAAAAAAANGNGGQEEQN